jgi:hypothetical protein
MNKETVEEIYPVEEVAKEVLQNNNLPVQGDFAEGFIAGSILGAEWQKEQSATDAIEFADWCEDNYWPTGQTGLWRPEASSEEVMLTTKELYELWKKSK